MRTFAFRALLLVALYFVALSSQAGAATARSFIRYDEVTGQVYGVSSTQISADEAIYYDAVVDGYLYNQFGNLLDQRSDEGGSTASANTQAAGAPGIRYDLYSDHYVGAYFYYCDEICDPGPRYDDPYGFNLYPGNTFYGSYYDFGWYYYCFVYYQYFYLGTTGDSVTVPQPSEPNFALDIVSNRISGVLDNTTQNAMLAAGTLLQARVTGAATVGTYNWEFTGPYQITEGSTGSNIIKVQWTELGTYTARISYTESGVTASEYVNINVVLPTLTSYTGTQGTDYVSARRGCSNLFATYRLGCAPPDRIGMHFTATVQAPSVYISDPAQSGIKYVQAVSAFRKQLLQGNVQCLTRRSSESDINSGWQRDSGDPYNPDPTRYPPARPFSEGNALQLDTLDYPFTALNGTFEREATDAVYVDDRFEMYVYYFGGTDFRAPVRQRPIGRLVWNWGGQVVFDARAVPELYRREFTNAPPTSHTGSAMGPDDSPVPYEGRGQVQELEFGQCPGGPAPIANQIDNTRFFVRQQYKDFFNRENDPDQDLWVSVITDCAFDTNCINNRRIEVARGFMESPEYRQIVGGPFNPASPGTGDTPYNREYVRQCYGVYLRRVAMGGEDNGWLNILFNSADYHGVTGGFVNAPQYRQRFGPP